MVALCAIMNHLSGVDRLANRFSVMRHAQSKANAAGIIVSRIENDRQGDYGLTEYGRRQALAAAQGCGLPGDTVIYCSGFARARQTAQIVRAYLGAPEAVVAEALRERCFGHWEGSAAASYERVWAAGETDPGHADGEVEPAAAVLDRATAFIAQLERRHRDRGSYRRLGGSPGQFRPRDRRVLAGRRRSPCRPRQTGGIPATSQTEPAGDPCHRP